MVWGREVLTFSLVLYITYKNVWYLKIRGFRFLKITQKSHGELNKMEMFLIDDIAGEGFLSQRNKCDSDKLSLRT